MSTPQAPIGSRFGAASTAQEVIAGHDRELLETMDAIVELTTLGATRYGGNWSDYRARKALELTAAEHDLADAKKRVAEVARSAQETAERKARRDSAGKKKAAKGDMGGCSAGVAAEGRGSACRNATSASMTLGERESRLTIAFTCVHPR